MRSAGLMVAAITLASKASGAALPVLSYYRQDSGDIMNEIGQLRVFMTLTTANPYVRLLSSSLAEAGVDVQPMPHRLTAEWLKEAACSMPSILHFHWPSYGYTRPSRRETAELLETWLEDVRFAGRLGFRLVWTAHNVYPHDSQHLDLQHRARVGLIAACDAVVTHCARARVELERAFGSLPERVAIIPHPNYIGIYPGAPPQADCRAYLGLSEDEFVYLFFGQVRHYKGIDALIDAFVDIAQSGRRALLIAGQPSTASAGRNTLALGRRSGQIHVHPFFIPEHEVSLYFGAADVVVLPYRDVLSSGAAALAHSLARPVIAPALGCLTEALGNDHGWIYDPGQPTGLRDAMQAAASADCVAIGRRCLERVRSFTWTDSATQLRCLYQRVLMVPQRDTDAGRLAATESG